MKGYLIMSDFKDIDLSKFSLDLTKTMQYVNPVQDQMARIQREQEQTIRSIQKAREEKEAEELRRHNEIVAALKEAGEKGATIVIGDNANGIQIQQNSDGAMQEMTNSQTFNYDKALEVLKEIKEYIDFPQFQTTFKENSENVKAIIEDGLHLTFRFRKLPPASLSLPCKARYLSGSGLQKAAPHFHRR